MANATSLPGDLKVVGNIVLTGSGATISPARPRTESALEEDAVFPIPPASWFVWDSGQPLPATAASDDLAHDPGTFGTSTPAISAGDVKTLTATRRARTTIQLPAEYAAAGSVTIRLSSGMLTTVAGTSCTVDLEVFKLNREGIVSGSDICATAAQSINSLTFADRDFTITATTLEPGDILDVRLTIASVDGATGTAVKPTIGAAELLCDIRG